MARRLYLMYRDKPVQHKKAVTPHPPAFTATPSTVTKPTLVTLAWSSTGGTTATLNGQPVGLSGSMQFTPTHTTSYTLIVTGDGGTATQLVTVTFGTNRRRSVRK